MAKSNVRYGGRNDNKGNVKSQKLSRLAADPKGGAGGMRTGVAGDNSPEEQLGVAYGDMPGVTSITHDPTGSDLSDDGGRNGAVSDEGLMKDGRGKRVHPGAPTRVVLMKATVKNDKGGSSANRPPAGDAAELNLEESHKSPSSKKD
jgi:hypothetical protein